MRFLLFLAVSLVLGARLLTSVSAQVQGTGSYANYITTDMKNLAQVARTTATILEIIGDDVSPVHLEEMVKGNILQDKLM